MVVVFLGISFLIQAALHFFGFKGMLSKKIRHKEGVGRYQRGLVLPYVLFGAGFAALGSAFPTFEQQNSYRFCLYLILAAIVPGILLIKNQKKLD